MTWGLLVSAAGIAASLLGSARMICSALREGRSQPDISIGQPEIKISQPDIVLPEIKLPEIKISQPDIHIAQPNIEIVQQPKAPQSEPEPVREPSAWRDDSVPVSSVPPHLQPHLGTGAFSTPEMNV